MALINSNFYNINELFATRASTVITEDIDNSQNSFTILSITNFPVITSQLFSSSPPYFSGMPFRVVIDDEIMYVISIGYRLTVTRNYDGQYVGSGWQFPPTQVTYMVGNAIEGTSFINQIIGSADTLFYIFPINDIPNTPPYNLIIGQSNGNPSLGQKEIVRVTGVEYGFWVIRGFENTTAVSHTNQSKITQVLTQGGIDNRFSGVINKEYSRLLNGTYSQEYYKPFPLVPGKIVISDSGLLRYDDSKNFDDTNSIMFTNKWTNWSWLQPIANNITISGVEGATSLPNSHWVDATGTYFQATNTGSTQDNYIFFKTNALPYIDTSVDYGFLIKLIFALTQFSTSVDTYSAGVCLAYRDTNTGNFVRILFELEFNAGKYFLNLKRINSDGSIYAGDTYPIDLNNIKWFSIGGQSTYSYSYDGITAYIFKFDDTSVFVVPPMGFWGMEIFINPRPAGSQLTLYVPYVWIPEVLDAPQEQN